MNLLDIFEGREPYQQAIDRLEQRRIEDLEAKMDELAHRVKSTSNPEHKKSLLKAFLDCKAERDSYYKLKEAGIGQDIVNKSEKMARATPSTPVGKVASTVKNAAKWLAGQGGPGKEGPTYEEQEHNEDNYEQVLDAIAALYGPEIWDNDAMGDLANDLEQVNPTPQELDFIIKNGKLPKRLQGMQFTNNDTVQFGEAAYTGDRDADEKHIQHLMRKYHWTRQEAEEHLTSSESDSEKFDESSESDSINPNAKCRVCKTPFNKHFRFGPEGKILSSTVRGPCGRGPKDFPDLHNIEEDDDWMTRNRRFQDHARQDQLDHEDEIGARSFDRHERRAERMRGSSAAGVDLGRWLKPYQLLLKNDFEPVKTKDRFEYLLQVALKLKGTNAGFSGDTGMSNAYKIYGLSFDEQKLVANLVRSAPKVSELEKYMRDTVSEGAVDSKSWMAEIKAKYSNAKFMQAKMPGAPIRAYVDNKVVAEFSFDQSEQRKNTTLDEKKLGQNRPKLGSARDLGKSVRKFRAQRGLEEAGTDSQWSKESDWKTIPKAKSGRPVDPRGEVTHLSDVARREAERKADQKKNSEEVAEEEQQLAIASKYTGDGQFQITVNNKHKYIVTVAGFEINPLDTGILDSFYLTDAQTGKTKHVASTNSPLEDAIYEHLWYNQRPALKQIYAEDMAFYEKHGWDNGRPDRLEGLPLTGWNATPATDFIGGYKAMKRVTGQKELDEKKLGQNRPKLGTGRNIGKSVKKFRAQRGLNEGQQLHVGDPIVVTGSNEFEGATGEIYDFSPSGTFVIVDLYNHGKHSMHLSDVEYNQYADDQEEDDWYDDANVNDVDDGPQHAYNSDERTRSDQYEGFQDFNKVEPYAVCLAGKPVKKFDYYEQARRFHDNWKQKLYREGNKEKANKITLLPLGLDESSDRVDPILYKALDRMQPGIAGQGQPGDDLFSAARTALATEWGLSALRSEYATATTYTRKLIDLYLAKHGAKQGVAEEQWDSGEDVTVTQDDQSTIYQYKGCKFVVNGEEAQGEAWWYEPGDTWRDADHYTYEYDEAKGIDRFYDNSGQNVFNLSATNQSQWERFVKAKAKDFVSTMAAQPSGATMHEEQGVTEADLDENLRDWFGKEKWVRMDTKGNIKGDCARGSETEGKPKCLPQAKAHALGKKGRASAAQKKRREDPDPERRGKAINVATKVSEMDKSQPSQERHGDYPLGAKGTTAKPVTAKKAAKDMSNMLDKAFAKEKQVKEDGLDEACWKGYHKEGNKELFGKTVPNCVKNEAVSEDFSNDISAEDMIAYLRKHHDTNLHQDYLDHINTFGKFVLKNIPTTTIKTELSGLDQAKVEQYKKMDFSKAPPIVMGDGYILDGYHRATVAKALGIPTIRGYVGVKGVAEDHESCPECGGAIYPDTMINEKQDACYYKVKSRYKVWPSAYASGALVQCRKKGAKNWGNKSESATDSYTGVMESQGITDAKLLEVARRIDLFARSIK